MKIVDYWRHRNTTLITVLSFLRSETKGRVFVFINIIIIVNVTLFEGFFFIKVEIFLIGWWYAHIKLWESPDILVIMMIS